MESRNKGAQWGLVLTCAQLGVKLDRNQVLQVIRVFKRIQVCRKVIRDLLTLQADKIRQVRQQAPTVSLQDQAVNQDHSRTVIRRPDSFSL